MDDFNIVRDRIEYAMRLLAENNIPAVIRNQSTGQINLLRKGKSVISYYANTGTIRASKLGITRAETQGVMTAINLYKDNYQEQ